MCVALPSVREVFEQADVGLKDTFERPLSSYVYPRPSFTDDERKADEAALTDTRVAQPAIGAADAAMLRLVCDLGIAPDFTCGHSYGEYPALYAAGVISFAELMRLSEARGRLIAEAGGKNPGTMAAVSADAESVERVIAGAEGVWLANLNSPTQTVISGTDAGVTEAMNRLASQGFVARKIKVSCAFHSPLVAEAKRTFGEALYATTFSPPRVGVFSNTTAALHAKDPAEIHARLAEHLARPVRFVEEVRAMHEAGARIFVEVGPGRVLTGLIEQILKGRSFAAIALNAPGRDDVVQLLHGLAQLAVAGGRFHTDSLFAGRTEKILDLAKLVEQSKPAPLARTTWMISGAKSVPLNGNGTAEGKVATNVQAQAAATRPMLPLPPGVVIGTSRVDRRPAPSPHSNGPLSPTPGPIALPAPAPGSPIVGSPASSAVPGSARLSQTSSDGMDAVIAAHQQLMSRFLEAHKSVMLAMLGRGHAPVDPSAEMAPSPVATYAASTSRPETAEPIGAAQAAALTPVLLGDEAAAREQVATVQQAAAPVLEAGAAAAISESVNTGLSREKLVSQLIGIVADRTGYPPEMLNLDSDLEADLGIDSIKRIEILGALQSGASLPAEAVQGDMESLSRLKTLRAIADWLGDKFGANGDSASGTTSPAPTTSVEALKPPAWTPTMSATPSSLEAAAAPIIERVPRMLIRPVERPITDDVAVLKLDGAVVITDDEQGVAAALAVLLAANGLKTVLIRADRGASVNGQQPKIKQTSPKTVKAWVQDVKAKHGRIAAVVHLLPLAHSDLSMSDDPRAWRAAIDVELLSLFNLAQALEDDLRLGGDGRVMVATRMGGSFGCNVDGGTTSFWPGNGGVCGLAKTLAREWPEVVSRVVDFDGSANADSMAGALLAELASNDPAPEAGRRDGRRFALVPGDARLAERAARLELTRDSVVLVTGGARGITADSALSLARRFHPKLVLLGRSPLPPEQELPATVGITDLKQLKAAMMRDLERGEGKVTPAKVEAALGRLLREREARANLKAMREVASVVEYHILDVADSAALSTLIDESYRRYGRIDGVVHGAGVIEDKLIRDKTPESFARVFDGKVNAALTLASKLRGEELKFLVFFSSVSARYGNRGQCDYAAANEILNKLAVRLDARWKARVVSMNWGPWESTGGMVSAELAKQFEKAGIRLIGRQQGADAFVDELMYGQKGETEIVLGGPLNVSLPAPTMAAPPGTSATASELPLLARNTRIERNPDGSLDLVRTADPQHDLYLIDHQLDGKPVMPMAMVLELFAEAAAFQHPDHHVARVRDLRVLRGITFDRSPQDLRVVTTASRPSGAGLIVGLRNELGQKPVIHDTAEVELLAKPAAPVVLAPLSLVNPQPLGMTIDEAYERWLFHGPIFAGIVEVAALGENGVIAQLMPSSPKRCLAECCESNWLIDPILVDSGLQMIILWARTYLDMTPLPSRLGCYHRFNGPPAGPIRCETHIHHTPGTPTIVADIRFFDGDGRLLGRLEDMEGTCSKALNRLASARVR